MHFSHCCNSQLFHQKKNVLCIFDLITPKYLSRQSVLQWFHRQQDQDRKLNFQFNAFRQKSSAMALYCFNSSSNIVLYQALFTYSGSKFVHTFNTFSSLKCQGCLFHKLMSIIFPPSYFQSSHHPKTFGKEPTFLHTQTFSF